jgi:recombinational DNA repair ATPase RecF
MRIDSLTIRGFRGFNSETTILLDSNVVLIYGLNGAGKSSFTEALEWLFFNEISRQRLSACRQEYQHEEYLRNLFYQETTNPFVEVKGSIGGKATIIRKELIGKTVKHILNGAEVANWNSLPLKLESYFRPMLAQTEIKALVDSEEKERWEQLASILGQDDLTRLRSYLQNLRNSKRDESFRDSETRWNIMKSEAAGISGMQAVSTSMASLDKKSIATELGKVVGKEGGTHDELLKVADTKQKALLNTGIGQRVVGVTWQDHNALKDFISEPIELFQEWGVAFLQATEAGYDHDHLSFLSSGAKMAKLPDCPFCLAATLSEDRLKAIGETLKKAQAAQTAKTKSENTYRSIKEWIGNKQQTLGSYFPPCKELKILAQGFMDINSDQLAKDVQILEKEINDSLLSTWDNIKITIEGGLAKCLSDKPGKPTHRETISSLNKIGESLAQFQTRCGSEWQDLKTRIATVIPLAGATEQDEVKRWIAIEKIITFFSKADNYLIKAKLVNQVESILKKLEKFEKDEVERLLKEHGEEIGTYYSRLNPDDKVSFSGIEVKSGVRRQAKLKAKAYGKDVNPVTFFSEAHTNSLALSIYFPQRVDRNLSWEVVVLDDPVQSMDANHSQALIEILVETSKKKQVIVLTHSKEFWRRLVAWFSPSKPLGYNFYCNDSIGPQVQPAISDTLYHLDRAIKLCSKGDPKTLEEASAQLRKAIESVCIEYLLEKGVSFKKAKDLQVGGFSGLFTESTNQGIEKEDVAKMKSLMNVSNSDSHAWSIVDTTAGGIKTGERLIREIYTKYQQQ